MAAVEAPAFKAKWIDCGGETAPWAGQCRRGGRKRNYWKRQVKSRFTLLGGKKAMCRGGGSRAQGLVRAGAVPTTPRSLERARQEMSHLSVVLWMRPGIFLFVFSLTKQLRTCLLSKRVEILRQKSKWGRALWELCRYCGQSGADWGRFGRGVRHQVLEVWWGRVRSQIREVLLSFAREFLAPSSKLQLQSFRDALLEKHRGHESHPPSASQREALTRLRNVMLNDRSSRLHLPPAARALCTRWSCCH